MSIKQLGIVVSGLASSLLVAACSDVQAVSTMVELGEDCRLTVDEPMGFVVTIGHRFRVSGNCVGERIDFEANVITIPNRRYEQTLEVYSSCARNSELDSMTSRAHFRFLVSELITNRQCIVDEIPSISVLRSLVDYNQIQLFAHRVSPYNEPGDGDYHLYRYHSENASAVLFARFLGPHQERRFLCIYRPAGFDEQPVNIESQPSIERSAAQCAVEHLISVDD